MNLSTSVAAPISQTSANLLDQYQPDCDLYFASPARALLARPPFANLLISTRSGLAQQVNESLRFALELGLREPIAIGAVPFDANEPACLRVSTNYRAADRASQRDGTLEDFDVGQVALTPVPAPQGFKAGVDEALRRFRCGELDKVVLSRTLEIDCEQPPNVRAVVKRLASRNRKGYTFAVNLKAIDNERSDGRVRALVGASPELLLSRQGNQVVAHPLAGSAARSDNPEVDEQRAQDLLRSDKDRREHQLVITAIEEALRPYCRTLQVPREPSLVSTAALWHLGTRIEGELTDPETTSLELALALHPTPAVCGYPEQAARRAIAEIEPHRRDLFTGMVGWCDASGDGEWVVTIRCASFEEQRIRLYAGAGIVPGSTPEKELAETGTKFHTLLSALGLEHSGAITP